MTEADRAAAWQAQVAREHAERQARQAEEARLAAERQAEIALMARQQAGDVAAGLELAELYEVRNRDQRDRDLARWYRLWASRRSG